MLRKRIGKGIMALGGTLMILGAGLHVRENVAYRDMMDPLEERADVQQYAQLQEDVAALESYYHAHPKNYSFNETYKSARAIDPEQAEQISKARRSLSDRVKETIASGNEQLNELKRNSNGMIPLYLYRQEKHADSRMISTGLGALGFVSFLGGGLLYSLPRRREQKQLVEAHS